MRVAERSNVERLLRGERTRRRLRHVVRDEARRAFDSRHRRPDRVGLRTPERRNRPGTRAVLLMTHHATRLENLPASRRVRRERVLHCGQPVGAGDFRPHRNALGDEGKVREDVLHLAAPRWNRVSGERPCDAEVHAVGERDHGAAPRHVFGKARVRSGQRRGRRLQSVILMATRATQVRRGDCGKALRRKAQEIEPAPDRRAHRVRRDFGLSGRVPRRLVERVGRLRRSLACTSLVARRQRQREHHARHEPVAQAPTR